MTISILGKTITLSPADTGAKLDVDAVVAAALAYNESGKNTSNAYNLSIIDYLHLDKDYIRGVLSDLGKEYSTTLSQSSYTVIGERPSMEQEIYDTETAFQTLTIKIGTAEYGLNIDKLYQQILDAYDINLFEVTGECTVIAPTPLDYAAIFKELCVEPVNADMDPETYEITPEVYGYGFPLETLMAAVENAQYGDVINLPMFFIQPDITSDFYSGEMFQNILGSFSTKMPADSNMITNLKTVCKILNGTIIKAGEEFSFNDLVGAPSVNDGFVPVNIYLGKTFQSIVGGGISQAASTLYYCALLSELEILERTSHGYTVDYIQAGFDAQVYHGSMDFRFCNNTDYPIRIQASISNGYLSVSIIGTDSRTHTLELTYKIDQTLEPSTVINTMMPGNVGGYVSGDVLDEGQTGYVITTYILKYDEFGTLIEETLIAESYYAKRDKVIVNIYEPPVQEPTIPDPTLPSEPTIPGPTDPSEPTIPGETLPSEPAPTDPTIPGETVPEETTPLPTDPTEPSEPLPTDPTVPSEPLPTDPTIGETVPADPTPGTEE
jgi:vancomycin resistance protein YoaR